MCAHLLTSALYVSHSQSWDKKPGWDQTTPISLTVVPNSKPNHACLFLCLFLELETRLHCWHLSHKLPRGKVAYEHRCRFQGGQKKVACDTGTFAVHGSLAQSRAGVEELRHAWVCLCILVSLVVWLLSQKYNCDQSLIPVDAARSKKFTFSQRGS